MNEIIPFLEFCLNADNRPSAVVASRINVVMFSINPSSSEMLFPASCERKAIKTNATPANTRKMTDFLCCFWSKQIIFVFLFIDFVVQNTYGVWAFACLRPFQLVAWKLIFGWLFKSVVSINVWAVNVSCLVWLMDSLNSNVVLALVNCFNSSSGLRSILCLSH